MERGILGRAAAKLVMAAACSLSLGLSAAQAGPKASVDGGTLEGVTKGGVDQFLGVPFAAPPVGELRWAKPAPVKPWPGTRSATAHASKCVQNGWVKPIQLYRNEDCLYLNVYRPAAPATSPRPVLVWFHGGASVAGASQDIDGSVFAEKADHVVIGVNYRLGAFGLASFAQSGSNFWLMDQQAALRWVKANARAFGGDPDHVTIIGQSAGAYSVAVHMVSPESAGLFQRAIAMSLPVGPLHSAVSAEEERQKGPTTRMVEKAGCSSATDLLACMRGKSTEEVFEAGGGAATRAAGWQMVVDRQTIPETPMTLFGRGEFHKVPVLVGFTSEEQGFFLQARRASGQPPLSADALAKTIASRPNGARIAEIYNVATYGSPTRTDIALASDRWGCEVRQWIKVVSSAIPVFSYEFADPKAPTTIFHVDEPVDGPFHNSDIPYVFQSGYPNEQQADAPAWTRAQKALSDRMLGYVARFSKSSMPSADWPKVETMTLHPEGDRIEADAAFAKRHSCEVWER
ncbi:carboxylesterase family protein [Bosea sp. LjRoot90]